MNIYKSWVDKIMPVEVEKMQPFQYECPQCGSECLKSDENRILFCTECDFAILIN